MCTAGMQYLICYQGQEPPSAGGYWVCGELKSGCSLFKLIPLHVINSVTFVVCPQKQHSDGKQTELQICQQSFEIAISKPAL